jgi:HD-GYP domain-containing protein (c-di-GMP phosphodiesterase class II)
MRSLTKAFTIVTVSHLGVMAFTFFWLHRLICSSIQFTADSGGAAGAPVVGGDVFQSLAGTMLVAFLWSAVLQCIVIYMVATYVRDDNNARELQEARERLGRTNDLVRTRDAVIFGLAQLAESRDPETGQHLERIALYSTRLSKALAHHPRYQSVATPAFVRLIGISSALHDIGKVGVRDSILLKPGPLSPGERLQMQEHAKIGAHCIQGIERRLGSSNFLQLAREIALHHHENWDGTGYPDRLAGHAIPLAARIVAIADVYDALSSRRVYKEAYSHEKCVAIIRAEANKKFDPDLVRVFLEIEHDFRAIADRLGDHREPAPFPTVGADGPVVTFGEARQNVSADLMVSCYSLEQ